MSNVLTVSHLSKSYRDNAEHVVDVLKDVSFSIDDGEIVAIVGASGAGKSTLLHILGALDSFDSGTVKVMGQDIGQLNETQKGDLRNHHMGFVYQFHHLQPEFTALENVAMPLFIRREAKESVYEKARLALTRVGLENRLDHLPSQLSGGERQRVAIARAIVADPDCVLADEPTGNLDSDTAQEVFNIFLALAREKRQSIVIVTHDMTLAKQCDRILRLENFKVR